jgi:hypothetical protein
MFVWLLFLTMPTLIKLIDLFIYLIYVYERW